jgi:hypothetical protein
LEFDTSHKIYELEKKGEQRREPAVPHFHAHDTVFSAEVQLCDDGLAFLDATQQLLLPKGGQT